MRASPPRPIRQSIGSPCRTAGHQIARWLDRTSIAAAAQKERMAYFLFRVSLPKSGAERYAPPAVGRQGRRDQRGQFRLLYDFIQCRLVVYIGAKEDRLLAWL